MTDTPHPLAALLRDVPRYRRDTNDMVKSKDGPWLHQADVLAALTLPDDDEAGKVLEGVTPGKWEPHHHDDYSELAVYHPEFTGLGHVYEAADANFIAWCRTGVPALLAQRAADAARIREAVKMLDEKDREYNHLTNDMIERHAARIRELQERVLMAEAGASALVDKAIAAEARIAALEATVERMRGTLEKAEAFLEEDECACENEKCQERRTVLEVIRAAITEETHE